MLETIAGGLIVAAITGLIVLAYKRPDEYWWLASKLMMASVIAMFLYFAFELGYSRGATDQLAADGITGTKHKMLGEDIGAIAVAGSMLLNLCLGCLPMLLGALKREAGKT